MDEDHTSPGDATVLSAVLLFGNTFYMTHYVQECGKNRVTSCAQQLLSAVDGTLNSK